MSTPERAGSYWSGRFCATCDSEILETDLVIVDEDGDVDDEGKAINTSTVRHAGVCPPEE